MNDNTYRNEQMTEENILEKDLNESQVVKIEENLKEQNLLREINSDTLTQGSTKAESSIRSKFEEESKEKIEKNKVGGHQRLNLKQASKNGESSDLQKEKKTPIDPSYQEAFNYIQQNRGIESNQNEVQQIQDLNRDINDNENIENQMEVEQREQAPHLIKQNLVQNNNKNNVNNINNNEPVNQVPQLIQQNQNEINNFQNNNEHMYNPQYFIHEEILLNNENNQDNADEILNPNFPFPGGNRHEFNLPPNPIFDDPESLNQNEPAMMFDEEAFENHNDQNAIYESFYLETKTFTENNG